MQTHQLKRNHPNMKRVIVARGGKRGKTAGRGGKGQSARAGNKRRPEWRDIIKRLPKLRGRGVNQNKPVTDVFKVINVSSLESVFSAGDTITPTTLIEKGVISSASGRIPAVKILGDGEVTKAFKISGCSLSGSAKEKIEKAGGTVTALKSRVVEKVKAPKMEGVGGTTSLVTHELRGASKEAKMENPLRKGFAGQESKDKPTKKASVAKKPAEKKEAKPVKAEKPATKK